jgi:hypothetical protein
MDVEKIAYEAKPFLCLGIAVYCLVAEHPTPLILMLAFVLIGCGAFILDMRIENRKKKSSTLNTLFYTAQPFLYIGLGVWAVATESTSKLAIASAAILFICACIILKWRTD